MTYSDDDVNGLLEEIGQAPRMDPAFKRDLRERLRRRNYTPPIRAERVQVRPRRLPKRSLWGGLAQAAAALIFVVLVGLVAWQQAAVRNEPRYFVRIDAARISDYQQPPIAAEVRGQRLWRNLTLEEAQAAVDFPLIEPELGEGWQYTGTMLAHEGQAATLTYRQYRSTSVHITQQIAPPVWSQLDRLPIGLDMHVQSYIINGAQAEYVEGSWRSIIEWDRSALSLDDRQRIWEADAGYQTLRWRDGDYVLTVQVFGDTNALGGTGTDMRFGVEEMIDFVESLNLSIEDLP